MLQETLCKPTIQFFMAYYKSLAALPQLFSVPKIKRMQKKKVKGPCVYNERKEMKNDYYMTAI